MKAPLIIVMFASLLALTACTVTLTTPTPDVGAPAPTSAATAAGAYVVQAYQGNAAVLDAYRQGTLPALLETVTVTE